MKLKDVATIKHGYAYKGEYFTNTPTKNILLTPTNFTLKGGFQYSDRYYSNDGEMPEEYNLHKDDLIVTMTDLSKEIDTIGYGALIPDDPEHIFLHNQRIGLVNIFNPIVDKFYLYWLMRTKFYQRTIAGSSNGATVHHTSPGRILSFNWEFPPLATQQKIASILSAYDSQIENNQKRIKLLEQMAENLYKEWFVRFRFSGYETAEFEGGVPKEWNLERLEDFGITLETGSRPKGGIDDSIENGVPSLGAEAINGLAEFDYGNQKLVSQEFYLSMKRGQNKGNHILVYKDGAYIGKVTIFRNEFPFKAYAINEHVFFLNAKDVDFQNYLYFTLHQSAFFTLMQNLNRNAAQPGLSQQDMYGIKVLKPEKEIVLKFNNFVEPLFNEVFDLAKQIKYLTTQRDLLLPRLMSSKLSI